MQTNAQKRQRISFNQIHHTMQQIYQGAFQLSYMNTGDQYAHQQNTHDVMVNQKNWLSQTQYKEVHQLCSSLPGPTTTQIIISVVTLKTKSLQAGINAIVVYNIVPLISLTILGILSMYFIAGNIHNLPHTLKLTFMGFSAAAAGIMMRSLIKFSVKNVYKWPKILIMLMSATIFVFDQSIFAVLFCLGLGAIVSLYLQFQQPRKKMSAKSAQFFQQLQFNFILGKTSIYTLVGILFMLWIYFSFYNDSKYAYILGFYLVSFLIIGPKSTMFAYYIAVLIPIGHLTIQQIWIGLPMAYLIPGSPLNIGIYYGAMLDGIRGALLAAIFLYLPVFLYLYGLLPQWRSYRNRVGIQRLMQGIKCSSNGLTLAVVILILRDCCKLQLGSTMCIFILSTYLNYLIGRYSYAIILIGGFLGWMRYYGLVCFRYYTDCPFPFNY